MWLLLGAGVVLVLLGAAKEFSRAEITTLKGLAAWVATLGGIALCGMLMLTGREAAGFGVLLLAGPLAWTWWQEGHRPPRPGARRPLPRRPPPMSREEAGAVLGLAPGASEAEIRAAWKRVIQGAHPDRGGSDWLAARVNQARDVLLRQ